MWRDNLIRLINESGLTVKQIAERGNLSEKTVIRVKSSKNCSACPVCLKGNRF